MFPQRRILAGLAALAFWTIPTVGLAQEEGHSFFHFHHKPRSTQATPHTFHQAGHPEQISRIAHPSYNEHYSGGFVGGGKGIGGHDRCQNEGTWGWDYTPFRPMSSHIFMNYSHGRHLQGGTNGYATEGPKPIEHIKESVHEHIGHD